MSSFNRALADILVVDLSRILAGPYCTMLLADYGATVLKVEQPKKGDGTRTWGPPWIGSESAYYLSVNRNKQSLTLDLKSELGKEVLLDLIAGADVLVENFKPGTTERLGIDYETLAAIYPQLVYCSISGYGQNGPYRNRPGYDFMIQAQGGIMSVNGPVDGAPYKVGVAIVDITAGLYASNAILAALHERLESERGQYIDVALLDTQVGWLANVAHNYFASGEDPQRYGNAHPNIVPYETFPTADSHIALAIGSDGQFQRFCERVGRHDLWQETRFQTNAGRVKHRDELVPELQKLFRGRNTDDWIELLLAAEIPVGPINTIPQILGDPQIVARQMVQEVTHPEVGPIKMLGPVAKLSRTPADIRRAPPTLGEHTDKILRDRLGYSPERITSLRESGII